MGWYERYACPWLTDRALDNGWVRKHRGQLLGDVQGRVLELGFGTGLNLPFYPSDLAGLDVVDPSQGMHMRAQARLSAVPFDVRKHRLSAETLPFADASFDAVISTFTLCTIADVEAAIREVRRVLTANGRFLVFEHVASEKPAVRRWQDRLNPIQRLVGCGCNLNRDVQALLTTGGFDISEVGRIGEPRMHALVREHVFGAARPA